MKRYMVFFGSYYYPGGGMNDFVGDFNTKQEAIDAVNREVLRYCDEMYCEDGDVWQYQWAHIYDNETKTYISEY